MINAALVIAILASFVSVFCLWAIFMLADRLKHLEVELDRALAQSREGWDHGQCPTCERPLETRTLILCPDCDVRITPSKAAAPEPGPGRSMEIEPDEVPLCPHCDQPIMFSDYVVMQAHGAYYLAHEGCVEPSPENGD